MEQFELYCNPKANITYERHIFNTRKQQADEKIDDFITNLKTLADNCDYGQIKDSIIRDVLIIGISNSKLRENMLREPDLSLQKAIHMARAAERAH